MIAPILDRLYSDFLLPDRLPSYRELLQRFLDAGVQLSSVVDYWDRVCEHGCKPEGHYLVLRHDIDTDVSTARAIWDIETGLGVKSSNYFRLSTIEPVLMLEMHAQGSEASYHYEEIATFAKLRRLKTAAEVERHLPEIKEVFRENLLRLREATGLPMRTVASHGDFVNRALGYPNWKLLADSELRAELEIDLEVYDSALESLIDARHRDTLYPNFWIPREPAPAMSAEKKHLTYLLTHPRHWRTARLENLLDDLNRLWEGLRYGAL